MSRDSWIWECERVISSEPGAGQQVLEHLIDRLRHEKWDQRDVFGVQLAVEEALVNAIKHGNGNDPAKQVQVAFRLAPRRVRIEIADEGPGFDPTAVPDPTDPDHIDTPSGRGLMLMRNFMSLVEYNRAGNRVTLEKLSKLDGQPPHDPSHESQDRPTSI